MMEDEVLMLFEIFMSDISINKNNEFVFIY